MLLTQWSKSKAYTNVPHFRRFYQQITDSNTKLLSPCREVNGGQSLCLSTRALPEGLCCARESAPWWEAESSFPCCSVFPAVRLAVLLWECSGAVSHEEGATSRGLVCTCLFGRVPWCEPCPNSAQALSWRSLAPVVQIRARVSWPVRQCRHLMGSDAWAHLFTFFIEQFGHIQSPTVFYNSACFWFLNS